MSLKLHTLPKLQTLGLNTPNVYLSLPAHGVRWKQKKDLIFSACKLLPACLTVELVHKTNEATPSFHNTNVGKFLHAVKHRPEVFLNHDIYIMERINPYSCYCRGTVGFADNQYQIRWLRGTGYIRDLESVTSHRTHFRKKIWRSQEEHHSWKLATRTLGENFLFRKNVFFKFSIHLEDVGIFKQPLIFWERAKYVSKEERERNSWMIE